MIGQWLIAALTAFVLIAPVELPDKTFVATLVLSTRYRPLSVWCGVVAAFLVQCLVAVAAGHVLSLLPARPVQLVAAGIFVVGAVVLLHGARRAQAAEVEQEQEYAGKISRSPAARHGVVASFLVLFLAEWGDLSQLLTAGLVASGQPASAVFVGAFGALALVSGGAVLIGRWLQARLRLALIRYLGAAICTVLAVVTVVTALS